ncbi:hypothetical protein [Actinoplanes rectilineatus]|uniref:hypothetical protein n=1 Tax=Actinoplanes rectilineatus TaxID=113571 RepID=UPI0005F2A4AF|nr:hypothetical protein [Actinoplanes rectilineatus]
MSAVQVAPVADLSGEQVWRYLDGGAVRHLLPGPDAAAAVCSQTPWAGWEWRGAAPAERAVLAGLRDCLSCVRMAGCRHVACVNARTVRAEVPWSWRSQP